MACGCYTVAGIRGYGHNLIECWLFLSLAGVAVVATWVLAQDKVYSRDLGHNFTACWLCRTSSSFALLSQPRSFEDAIVDA